MSTVTIGKKIGMTRIFDKDGNSTAVTIVKVKPTIVSQVKTKEADNYDALQIAYVVEDAELNKPQAGHLKQSAAKAKHLVENRNSDKQLKVGDKITLDDFKEGTIISVSGISKGKGFAGVIKRHNFSRGPESHGSDHHRAPGSIGGGYPQRVIKGKKMAGHMGSQRVTVKGLEIVKINNQQNTMLVKGALPGKNGSLVEIEG